MGLNRYLFRVSLSDKHKKKGKVKPMYVLAASPEEVNSLLEIFLLERYEVGKIICLGAQFGDGMFTGKIKYKKGIEEDIEEE